MDLTGKTAIVTGASAGIGEATVRALADAGARVAGGARRVDRIPAEVALELDVSDAASCERFVAAAVAELGSIDILVNNAGVNYVSYLFDKSSEEDEAAIIGTNLAGVLRMTRLCIPHLATPAHIVNVGSLSGRGTYQGAAAYCASKYGERGFTYALREDLLGRPIRVTLVDPGLTETELASIKFKDEPEKAIAQFAGLDCLQSSDLADCILFAVTRPDHVNVDELVVKPLNHAGITSIHRTNG